MITELGAAEMQIGAADELRGQTEPPAKSNRPFRFLYRL